MLASLSERARATLVGVLGTGAAFLIWGGLAGSKPVEPQDAVPKDAFLVATVNLAELRRSPIYDVVLGTPRSDGVLPLAKGLGMGKLADACGFDPLGRVEKLAVAVPEEGDKGELGVAARVTVNREELEKCTNAIADQRGGKVETREIGGFVVVESSQTSGAAQPRLAYGHGGILVAGRGAWFDAMLSAADGKSPSLKDAREHVALRASLTKHDGWHTPTVLITALLPKPLRERLKNEMGAEIGSQDTSSAIMAGVLGVSAVGLALNAGGPGKPVEAAIELVCDDGPACAAVDKLIQKKRLELSKELGIRMIGFGPLIDSVESKQDGARIRVTGGTSSDGLASTIERVLKLRARRDPAPPPNNEKADPPSQERKPKPEAKPDETLTPKK
jgi:hypothetical protein